MRVTLLAQFFPPETFAGAQLVEDHIVRRAGVGLEQVGPVGGPGPPCSPGLLPVHGRGYSFGVCHRNTS